MHARLALALQTTCTNNSPLRGFAAQMAPSKKETRATRTPYKAPLLGCSEQSRQLWLFSGCCSKQAVLVRFRLGTLQLEVFKLRKTQPPTKVLPEVPLGVSERVSPKSGCARKCLGKCSWGSSNSDLRVSKKCLFKLFGPAQRVPGALPQTLPGIPCFSGTLSRALRGGTSGPKGLKTPVGGRIFLNFQAPTALNPKVSGRKS